MTDPVVTTELVGRLIADQFPQWAALPIQPVAQSGWDNRTFHLGPAMSVRLPSAARYAAQVAKEQRWLPHIARHVPLPITSPVAAGRPGCGYPFGWSVMTWLPGKTLTDEPVAADLADFLRALHRVPTKGGPLPGAHNFHRGGDLRIYDQELRHSLDQLGANVDAEAVMRIWSRACTSTWHHTPVWLHGDVAPGNLLTDGRKLSAVIDFGSCGIGDPACDLTIAWTSFRGAERATFKDRLALDPDTWTRAKGWALWKAALEACKGSPDGYRVITEVIGDNGR
ncbi:aminoglycoside phosphotransferase family protein [Yoonia sp. SS1-5]|uniref:Aminoglycoside phosphotransferase family protein n=1 Tax=Yoonia rhodophyticola TaxID=3137370 RepID=A0AAN0MG61_9RHOB